jgi:uncharacterized membrane protein YdjX (TVP38/TMEM64 family)
MKTLRVAVLLGLVAIALVFFGLGLGDYFSLEVLRDQRETLRTFVASNWVLSVVVYVLLYIAATALSLPGAAILTLAGGAIFGLVLGTIIVSFSSTIGATFAFLVSRFLLRDLIDRRFSRIASVVNRGIEIEGAFYLFGVRLVPLFPFFVINLVMGLTRMRAWTFFWVSQIGMLPGTVAYVNAGTQLASIGNINDVLSANVLFAFVLLAVLPIATKRVLARLRVGP